MLKSRFSRPLEIESTAGLIPNLGWGFRDVDEMKVRVPIWVLLRRHHGCSAYVILKHYRLSVARTP